MNKYKKYRELARIAQKAQEQIARAMDSIDMTLLPEEGSYWDSINGKGENAMEAHTHMLNADKEIRELDAEWSKVVKKLYKEYEDTPWD